MCSHRREIIYFPDKMSQQKRVTSKDFKPTPNNLEMVRKYTPFTLSPKLNRLRVPSIGWGTTIYPPGDPVLMTDPPIAIEMAEELLSNDCQNALIAIRFLIDIELEENQIVDTPRSKDTGILE
jgi:hypothetical protein